MTVVYNFYCHEGVTLISSFGVIYLVFLLVIPLFPSQLCSLGIFFLCPVGSLSLHVCERVRVGELFVNCQLYYYSVLVFFCFFFVLILFGKFCLLSPVGFFIRVVCFVNFVMLLFC